MNAVQIFENSEFGNIRAFEKDNETWFVGNDVAFALGYSQTAKAVREHVDYDDKGVSEMDTPGGKQQITIINESGLYSLVLSSKLPTARKFKKWVTSEVLPTIRKTGSYAVQPQTPQTYLEALEALVESEKEKQRLESERKSLEERNAKLQPKADFADAAFDTDSKVDIGMSAKILKLGFGRNTLFKKLKEKGVLFGSRNEPKQKYVDAGYFELTEKFIERNDHPASW